MAKQNSEEIPLTRAAIEAEAEALARKVLNTSAREAWARVRSGDLEGTLFASKLARLRALAGEGSPTFDDHLAHAAE